jgi:curved DNA-binding protein CbpA
MKEHFLEPRKTAYDVLGIELTATPKEIDHAYSRVIESIESVSKGDKDVSTGDVARELRITVDKAYDILSNPKKRGQYNAELLNSLTSHKTIPSSPKPLIRQDISAARQAARTLKPKVRAAIPLKAQAASTPKSKDHGFELVDFKDIPQQKPGFFSRIKHAITGRRH